MDRLDVQDLSLSLVRHPVELGAITQGSFDWVVPADWKTEVLGIEPGTVVPVEVTLVSLEDGVSASVSGRVDLDGQCVSCLAPVSQEQEFSGSAIYYNSAQAQKEQVESDIEVEGDELDQVLVIDRAHIDLEPLLRDVILGEADLVPVCSEGCLGICVHCGVLLKDAEPDHHHEFLDPRFAILEGFFDSDKNANS